VKSIILSVCREDRLVETDRGGGIRGGAIDVCCANVVKASGDQFVSAHKATRGSQEAVCLGRVL